MVLRAACRTGDRDGGRCCGACGDLVVRRCESFPVGQIQDPERTWAHRRAAWSLSFRPASVVRVAHRQRHGSGIGVGVVDRADTSRLERTPARTTDLVGGSHAHDGTAGLSGIREARSRAPRARAVVTMIAGQLVLDRERKSATRPQGWSELAPTRDLTEAFPTSLRPTVRTVLGMVPEAAPGQAPSPDDIGVVTLGGDRLRIP